MEKGSSLEALIPHWVDYADDDIDVDDPEQRVVEDDSADDDWGESDDAVEEDEDEAEDEAEEAIPTRVESHHLK